MVSRCPADQRLETLRKLFVDSSEATVREDGHHITWPHFARDRLHDCIRVGKDARAAPLFLDGGAKRGDIHSLLLRNSVPAAPSTYPQSPSDDAQNLR